MSRDPADYSVTCVPDRFGDDTVVFRCTVRIDKASDANGEIPGDVLAMEVPLAVSDTDSFGEMRRTALQLYGQALETAAKAVSHQLAGNRAG
jgi:hypothetical protein